MTSRFFKKHWRLLPGVFATLITVGLCQLGILDPLENASYQRFFQLRGEQPWDPRIVLIAIDDATLEQLGQFPISREYYTQLLQRLAIAPPAAIGFNILFIEPSAVDAALARAIAQAHTVVLASGIDARGRSLNPTEPLYSAAMAIGHIIKQTEEDGLIHSVEPVRTRRTAFGLRLLEIYALTDGSVTMPPLDSPFMINWPGSSATLQQYSFSDVLAGRIVPAAFDNKIVIIGMSATGVDAQTTPFEINPPASSLLLHAAVVDNVLQQRQLKPLPFAGLWGLLLLAMPIASYVLIGWSLRWQLSALAAGLAGWLGLTFVLFCQTYWWPVVPPLLLWGLTASISILSQQLRANFVLHRLLETLWQYYRQDTQLNLYRPLPSMSVPADLGAEVYKLALLANSLGWAQATQTAIAQAAPIGMVAADEQHHIWFCNPLAQTWLQVQLGDSLRAAVVPGWCPAETWQKTLQELSRGQAIAPLECQRQTQWFELRWERLDYLPQPSPLLHDARRGYLLLLEDITHRKAVELQLRLLNEGLEDEVRQRAQQLEATNLTLMQEILERQQVQEKLAHQALHDELTGLPNRAHFKTQLDALVKQSQQHPEKLFAVLFIDCDRFKLVNDSFGHLVGDELLKAIACRLRHCIARSDLVARFGGDEFTILLKHIKDAQAAVTVAQRIRQQLQKPFYIADRQLYTGASIGIVLSNDTYEQADDMLRDADTAMYRAKHGGIGFTLFEPEMHLAVRSSLQLETDLRRALQRQELTVYYQPIFSIQNQRIEGFEALLRWQHPTQGLIGPDEFIPMAEETGLIISIGQWVMREACMQLRAWQEHQLVPDRVFMSVNLSVQQFNEHHLLERIDEILAATHLDSRSLKLEITESAIMADSDLAVTTFHQLKERGIRLGIDDFGTGYSSLSYLHCFPIDVLKVDRSFIQRMAKGGKYLSLVQAIQTLAHHFDITMIAEGVETVAQMEHLKAMNCELGQGYFFCRPLDCQTLEREYLHLVN